MHQKVKPILSYLPGIKCHLLKQKLPQKCPHVMGSNLMENLKSGAQSSAAKPGSKDESKNNPFVKEDVELDRKNIHFIPSVLIL